MDTTGTLQDQQPTAIQQPRNDLQPTSPSTSSQNFTQDQLVAPQLRVGNQTVQQSSQAKVVPPTQLHHTSPLVWLLIPLVIFIIVVLWPTTRTTNVAAPEEVAPEPIASPPAQPTKPKPKSKKRKKSKR